MKRKYQLGDTIRLGVIGFGVQGHFDLQTALKSAGSGAWLAFAISIQAG